MSNWDGTLVDISFERVEAGFYRSEDMRFEVVQNRDGSASWWELTDGTGKVLWSDDGVKVGSGIGDDRPRQFDTMRAAKQHARYIVTQEKVDAGELVR